jgi:hypothetical protein
MAEPARTVFHPHEILPRLLRMGLREEHVHEAVQRGYSARRSCSPLHPPSFPGVHQWADTHLALRDLTSGDGWKHSDEANFSTVISPDRATAITVATGNVFTGSRGPQQPSTKYPRGARTQLAIEINKTLSLFDDPAEIEVEPPPPASRATWVLLIHTDRKAGEVRYELSRPEGQDNEGRVTSWSDRIIFPPLKIQSASPTPDNEPGTPPIDVPVDRI